MDSKLDIIGVIEDEVGTPRNDRTAGSALYKVPIRLNREADPIEARLIQQVWDSPPRFTTMHRPGILRVYGDTIVLDGTTIDEAADYHATTLRVVIERVNQLAAEHRSREAADQRRKDEQQLAHREHVAEVAKEIDFE